MSYRMHIVHNSDGTILDVTSLITNVTHTTTMESQPGKLKFTLKKDPNNILKLSMADIVKFWNNDNGVFYGYIFNIKIDSSGDYDITAYDQTRYLQNHDCFTADYNSLWYIFWYICDTLKLKYDGDNAPKINCVSGNYIDKSYFDILSDAIRQTETEYIQETTSEALQSATTAWQLKYCLRDEFGTLVLKELITNVWSNLEKLPIIGTGSLMKDYTYEVDIDRNTYNEVYALANAKDSDGKSVKTLVGAKDNFDYKKKWGTLRKIVTVNEALDYSTDEGKTQLDNYLNALLDENCAVSKTFKLSAIGMDGLQAGDCFILKLDSLNVYSIVYIVSATHSYSCDSHTMDFELSALQKISEEDL